jgi:hypothetical protein
VAAFTFPPVTDAEFAGGGRRSPSRVGRRDERRERERESAWVGYSASERVVSGDGAVDYSP